MNQFLIKGLDLPKGGCDIAAAFAKPVTDGPDSPEQAGQEAVCRFPVYEMGLG